MLSLFSDYFFCEFSVTSVLLCSLEYDWIKNVEILKWASTDEDLNWLNQIKKLLCLFWGSLNNIQTPVLSSSCE